MLDLQLTIHRQHQVITVRKEKEQSHLEDMIDIIREIKSRRY
jgi:hypothetical protein